MEVFGVAGRFFWRGCCQTEFLYSPAIIHTCTLQLRIMFKPLLPVTPIVFHDPFFGQAATTLKMDYPGWLGVEKLWSKQCTGPAFLAGQTWPVHVLGCLGSAFFQVFDLTWWPRSSEKSGQRMRRIRHSAVGWLVGWLVGCNLLMIDLMYCVLFCSFLRSGKHRLDSGILFLTQLTGKIAY